MTEVWVIVRDTNVVHGHGDSQVEPVLAYHGWDVEASHPAFTSEMAANLYLGELPFGLRAKRLELREESITAGT